MTTLAFFLKMYWWSVITATLASPWIPCLFHATRHGKALQGGCQTKGHTTHSGLCTLCRTRWLYVPKFWFQHFYAVGVFVTASLLVKAYISQASAASSRLLLYFFFHVLRRYLEQRFLFQQESSYIAAASYPSDVNKPGVVAKMHVLAYFLGLRG